MKFFAMVKTRGSWRWFGDVLVTALMVLGVGCQHQSLTPSAVAEADSNINFGMITTRYFQHWWAAHAAPPTLSAAPTTSAPPTPSAQPSAFANKLPAILVIEGDGEPWRNRFQVAGDPTSAVPLLLEWLVFTRHQTWYLGRPCYFGSTQTSPPQPPVRITGSLLNRRCDPYWYTFGRYSQVVVASMAEAAQVLAAEQCLILLGHSGGGTLAMLMARQMPRVAAVVTLAGNLNVTAWQQHHRYTPLIGSVDPAGLSPLPRRIEQMHVAADGDEQILSAWIEQEALRQQAGFQRWDVAGHRQWHASFAKLDDLLDELLVKVSCSVI